MNTRRRTLYTAVGHFRSVTTRDGAYPVVLVKHQEYRLDPQEMTIWSILNWRLLDAQGLEEYYEPMFQTLRLEERRTLENCLGRLVTRGLVAAGHGETDFEALYEALEGNPVTIRFLDPPLHEFVPTEEKDIELLAKTQGKSVADIKAIIASLHEFNPMMGHRGCRLAVAYPEIAAMQTRAVIKAALNVKKAHPDWDIVPEIMIPLVGEIKELAYVKSIVVKTADEVIAASNEKLTYKVGTMIEIPRAALLSGNSYLCLLWSLIILDKFYPQFA